MRINAEERHRAGGETLADTLCVIDLAVDAVEPNAIMTANALSPVDQYYSQQWGFTGVNGMRVPGAWDSITGAGMIVGVIDTGSAPWLSHIFTFSGFPTTAFIASPSLSTIGFGVPAGATKPSQIVDS